MEWDPRNCQRCGKSLYDCYDEARECCLNCDHPSRATVELRAAEADAKKAALAKLDGYERKLLGLRDE
jgi:hypothetical protein